MPSALVLAVLVPMLLTLAAVVAFVAYLLIRYTPIVGRIFEEKPLFLPLRVPPSAEGEEIRFAADGVELVGTYLRARTAARAGVIVFCHEYLGDRWSVLPYADALRDEGFDLFAFDFRNHGDSAAEPGYHPLQWVADREVRDLLAALQALRSRPDRDPAGVGLFGISRGGSTALCAAAATPEVWGVVTDGAFPTRGTMLAYILRWAEIYVDNIALYRRLPIWVFGLVGISARRRAEGRLGCRFPDVERATDRLAPRPWLMIHGAKDAYISPEIARGLFDRAGEPKELWVVPLARHNRCREVEPVAYRDRVVAFFRRFGPRCPSPDIGQPGPTSAPARAARDSVLTARPAVVKT